MASPLTELLLRDGGELPAPGMDSDTHCGYVCEGDNRLMTQIAIRCHPYAPIDTEDVQRWLNDELSRLRDGAPNAAIRLLRLSQPGPESEIEVGWQIELNGNGEPPVDDAALREVLRDLRLLGLQPAVLRGVGSGQGSEHPQRPALAG